MYNKTTTFIANEDLSGLMGYGVKMIAEMSGNLPKVAKAGKDEDIDGAIVEPAKAGAPVTVLLKGDFALVYLGGAVTVNDALAIDANGKFVKAEGSAVKVGKAYQSGVAGDYIKALLK